MSAEVDAGSKVKFHTERGNSYLEEAKRDASYHGRAVQEFVLAYKHVLLLNNRSGLETSCVFNLGAAYIAAGYFERGVEVLGSILNNVDPAPVENVGDNYPSITRGDVLYNIGYGYEKMNNYDITIRYYESAISDFKLSPQRRAMLCSTMDKVAAMHLKHGDHIRARGVYYDVINIYIDEQLYEEACSSMLRQVEAVLGDSPVLDNSCFSILDECLDNCDKIKNNVAKCKVLTELGLKYSLLGRFAVAVDCFDDVLRLSEDKQLVAVAMQNMGAVKNRLGEFTAGIPWHEKAIKLHGNLGNRNAQGQCFCNLANALTHAQRIDDAAEAFIHALQAFKDSDDKLGQWQVHDGLGRVYVYYGKYNKAVKQYKQAIILQAQSKDTTKATQDKLVENLSRALMLQHVPPTPRHREIEAPPPVEEPPIQVDAPNTQPIKNSHNYARGRREFGRDGRPLRFVNRGLSSFTAHDVVTMDGLDSYPSSSDDSDPDIKRTILPRHSNLQGSRRKSGKLNSSQGLLDLDSPSNRPITTEEKEYDKLLRDSGGSNTNYNQAFRDQLQSISESLTDVSSATDEDPPIPKPNPLPRKLKHGESPGDGKTPDKHEETPLKVEHLVGLPQRSKTPPIKPARKILSDSSYSTINKTTRFSPKNPPEHTYESIRRDPDETQVGNPQVTPNDDTLHGDSPDAPPLSSIYGTVPTNNGEEFETKSNDVIKELKPPQPDDKKKSRMCIVM